MRARADGVARPDLDGLANAFTSFTDGGARGAFAQTVRSALNWSGQRLEGTERLYLLADVPVLLVGGNRDSVIPIAHTVAAHELLPSSSLQIFDGAGHFPHVEQPQRFAQLLHDFLSNSAPARIDARSMRRRLLRDSCRTHRTTAAPGRLAPLVVAVCLGTRLPGGSLGGSARCVVRNAAAASWRRGPAAQSADRWPAGRTGDARRPKAK